MRYFLLLSALILSVPHLVGLAHAADGIISRAEWGADESLRYADNPIWQTRNASFLQYVQNPKTQSELDVINAEVFRVNFIQKHLGQSAEVVERRYTENWHPLRISLQKTKQVSRIILHHEWVALNKDKSDIEIIRAIYRNHTVDKDWWDIAYHYIIWQRGQIYEGRAGWDYVVGTHAAYNNMGTVGIVVLGDYSQHTLNKDQIAGLEKLIPLLAKKYGITLSAQAVGTPCASASCASLDLISTTSLIGHRDVRSTACPGTNMYPFIARWTSALDQAYTPVLNTAKLAIEPTPRERVMNMTLRVVAKPTSVVPSVSAASVSALAPVPTPTSAVIPLVRYIWPKFRVRLSYPDTQNIILATADGKIGKLMLNKQNIPMRISQKIQIGIVWNNQLLLKVGEKYYTGSVLRLAHSVVRIDSWDRVPDWDKSGRYNDNVFRDTIRVIVQDGKLVVINDLPLEWYLKGMWEVSNGDLTEKIKTIVVSARSYAKWYMDPRNRKLNTNLYDGSDDPDVFQKYLGYSYELRSPSVARVVDMTRAQVITYSGQLIKPWYHSSSDGRTLSSLEYCQKNGSSSCVDTPYLQSVVDPGSEWKTRAGHGVGISWIGATYWAQAGWDYTRIIQYYLKGVEIQKK